jgi:hypothetical protein
VNRNFIHELTFGSEQIAAGSGTATDQFWADRDAAFATDGHAIEPQINSRLVYEIQHEAIREIVGQKAVESEVSNKGTFVNGGSIVGIPNLNLGLHSTPPGGNGSISDLEVLDLQKLSLLSLQPGTDLFQIPEIQRIEVLPIVDVAAPLGQSKDQQNQNLLQHESSVNSSLATLSRHCWLVKKRGRIYMQGFI